jgi:ubiquinone/menaquinone biosynthesis C-methylase UbiE
MENDIKYWTTQKGVTLLKKIGIKEGQFVLDFGCGSGNYTIPAAKTVGNKGNVYAIDKDENKLKQLAEKAELNGLHNIKTKKSSESAKLGFKNNSFNVVLFYDIFWYFPLQSFELSKLLKETYRISKSEALISVYPEHIQAEKLKRKIENSGFILKNRFEEQVIHEDHIKIGQIFNFGKQTPKN